MQVCKLLISLFLLCGFSNNRAESQKVTRVPQRVVFLIHGTWGSKTPWYQPGGDFFDALRGTITPPAKLIPFTWSGGLPYDRRFEAAQRLVAEIQKQSPHIAVDIIAHSHGVNVAILAVQLLAQQSDKRKIDNFYAFAVPVDNVNCLPNMKVIRRFYNFFSLRDMVQPVCGIYERVYPIHPCIANIRLFVDGKEPGHSDIHHPVAAQWLARLHEFLPAESGKLPLFSSPLNVYFTNARPPWYEVDYERDKLLKLDKEVQAALSEQIARQLTSREMAAAA